MRGAGGFFRVLDAVPCLDSQVPFSPSSLQTSHDSTPHDSVEEEVVTGLTKGS